MLKEMLKRIQTFLFPGKPRVLRALDPKLGLVYGDQIMSSYPEWAMCAALLLRIVALRGTGVNKGETVLFTQSVDLGFTAGENDRLMEPFSGRSFDVQVTVRIRGVT